MKLGLVAYQNNRGLGIQTQAYYENLKPYRTMVIDNAEDRGFEQFPDRYPEAWKVVNGLPNRFEVEEFLHGLDVVLMAENTPTKYLLARAKEVDVKTVVASNYEFFYYDPKVEQPMPDLIMSPSLWHFEDIPYMNKRFVPVPIPQHPQKMPKVATNFLHIAGKPAANDRNGTELVFEALMRVKSKINVTLRCQEGGHLEQYMKSYDNRIPNHVKVKIETGNTKNYWDNYKGEHAMILPRRYGGLCLPANEAVGSGLPVIMPNISPNNTWLPNEWLVNSVFDRDFYVRQTFNMYTPHVRGIARLIDRMAKDENFYTTATQKAAEIRERMSWEKLKPLYIEAFESVLK